MLLSKITINKAREIESIENKLKLLSKENDRIGSVKIGIVDKAGKSIYTNGDSSNVKDRDVFQRSISW